MVTTILDLFGAGLLVAFAWFLWPPAALLVGGLALLIASQRLTTRRPR